MNARKRKSQLSRIQESERALRAQAFTNIDENRVWDSNNNKQKIGFCPIPRTMPLISRIMDSLSGKGKPVSSTYLELWCRNWELGFVKLNNPTEMAFASGFNGTRGVSTWRERLRRLEDLDFISSKQGPGGVGQYNVQIWNPYIIIKEHYQRKSQGLQEGLYLALFERASEIGAKDLIELSE